MAQATVFDIDPHLPRPGFDDLNILADFDRLPGFPQQRCSHGFALSDWLAAGQINPRAPAAQAIDEMIDPYQWNIFRAIFRLLLRSAVLLDRP